MDLPNFKSLEEDGFIILKNFIDSSELKLLKQDYEYNKSISTGAPNKNYYIINANTHPLVNKIKNVLSDIAKNISITLDTVNTSGVYFDNRLVTLDWHQDHEVFFKWQNAINSLNFWIPIFKPNIKEDGIMLIPHSALREKFPEETKKYIVGNGAQRFYSSENKTTIINDVTDEQITIDGNIFELKIVPEIEEGDILIMRGDCIHKTDKNINGRVSISIRCLNSKDIVDKNKFLTTGVTKKRYINNNPNGYKKFFKKFEQEPNRDTFTVAEIQSVEL